MAKYGSTAAERLAAKRNNTGKTGMVSAGPGGYAVRGGKNTVADIVAKAAGKKPATKTNSYTRPSSGSSAANPNLTAANDPRSYSKPTGGYTAPAGSMADRVNTKKNTTPAVSTPSYSGYNNGGLSDAQIRELQSYYGAAADGKWGQNSTAAAGGLSAAEAWEKYRGGLQEEETEQFPSYSGGVNDLSSYLRQQQQAQTEASLAALKNAYDKNSALYGAEREKLPALYAAQRNRLAADVAQSRRNYDERMLASGLNTGTAGQADLARSSVLQQGMADIGQAEADALSDIDLATAQLRAEYENAMNRQKAEDAAALMEKLYSEAVRMQNLRMQQAANSAYRTVSSGGSSGGRKSSGSARGEITPYDSGTALNLATKASHNTAGRIMALEAMYESGNITRQQYSDLVYALRNPGK